MNRDTKPVRSAIWKACQPVRPTALGGELWRLVESQEQIATAALVDTLDEQALLEQLLESSKPPPRAPAGHYLLTTPFRYPPLRHGSRFGGRHEPSLFYGSRELPTMLAEAGFYRLVFWHGMQTPPPGPITTQHTAFSVDYRSQRGLRLQAEPFDAHRAALTDPTDYRATQALGTAMREAGIEAFEFRSARCEAGLNVALYTPAALAGRRPSLTRPWVCRTRGDRVSFLDQAERTVHGFELEHYLVDGILPDPAA